MPDTPDAAGVVAALQEANARLREENAELKAQIAEQAEKIARLERLISRNRETRRCRRVPMTCRGRRRHSAGPAEAG